MIQNPFITAPILDTPLTMKICQEIHFYAYCTALGSQNAKNTLPAGFLLLEMRRLKQRHGTEVCLSPLDTIKQLFLGVTTATFTVIEDLYCNRIGRTIPIVYRILKAMAREAGAQAIGYEAVWAICLYLSRSRKQVTETTVIRSNSSWLVFSVSLPVRVIEPYRDPYYPRLVCIIDESAESVIAFRIGDDSRLVHAACLAIYDAVVANRFPKQFASGGLEWHLPAEVLVHSDMFSDLEKIVVELPFAFGCRDLQSNNILPQIDGLLKASWFMDIGGRDLTRKRLAMIFDNYFFRAQGFGPRRTQKKRRHSNRHLKAYNRDPAIMFPPLLCLLPSHQSVINDGAVLYDSLNYEHELLDLWPGQKVSLKRSEEEEARSWVFLRDEVFCDAMARELRRKDGSYRPHRPSG